MQTRFLSNRLICQKKATSDTQKVMMERSCPSSANLSSSSSSTSTVTITADDRSTPAAGNPCGQGGCGSSISNSKTSNSNVQSSLRSLNRASYKISKPVQRNAAAVPEPNTGAAPAAAAAQPLAPSGAPAGTSVGSGGGAPPYQPQPPVYNIDKNDFRDVVQKLTGSSAHHQIRPPPAEAPPPVPPPAAAAAAATAAPTSRLHRIRPPPLAHLSPRPPALVPALPLPAVDPWTRPPLSPLPPLPTVSAAAESPISAYMRRLRSGGGALAPSPTAAPVLPPSSSPLGFGCLLSPRTAYQMMMTAPALGLPTSPGVQLPSPRLGDS
ncbi:hypothetical protein C4D60_Mb10t11070 [Musa balbisiana]|uniref:VQ domain-containing protein n=1 Tax=Musa balbisiana TaxID=52838 RepID=A0A4S8IW75_MUSBA|nr:hypothetical protein C4D60_Mb10t11070 [Musa balbisiana]